MLHIDRAWSESVSGDVVGDDIVVEIVSGPFDFEQFRRTVPTEANELQPAVPIEVSITAAVIYCLEDGVGVPALPAYLRAKHGMTPEEYRKKWRLPPTYPMYSPDLVMMVKERSVARTDADRALIDEAIAMYLSPMQQSLTHGRRFQ